MKLREIKKREYWAEFVKNQEFSLFVQAPEYGDFYESMGEKSRIIGIYEGNNLIGGSLVLTTHAKRGNYLYLPYGPILPEGKETGALSILAKELKQLAGKKSCSFIRCSPFILDSLPSNQIFQGEGFRKAPMHVLAENTWLLKVVDSEEELLMKMNKNHRNLIRRCQREGVEIRKNGIEGLKNLNRMLDITALRLGFSRFSESYIEREFRSFADTGNAVIFESVLPDGTPDASAIVIFYGNMASYRHSASLNLNKRLPTPYLIQWEIIKEVKKRAKTWYNFWGVAPTGAPKSHPFYGITHFKKGFGGRQMDLLPCQDIIVSPKYWLNYMIETVRRKRRGF